MNTYKVEFQIVEPETKKVVYSGSIVVNAGDKGEAKQNVIHKVFVTNSIEKIADSPLVRYDMSGRMHQIKSK